MHLIEELVGFSPDGGNGVLEVFLLILPCVVALWTRKRAKLSDSGS
jgi:hypothetical protein